MLVPTLVSSISLALLSAALYPPYTTQLALHHASAPLDPVEAASCTLHATPRFCLDVALHRESGAAYLVCDEDAGVGRWDPLRGHWNSTGPASVWTYNIRSAEPPVLLKVPTLPVGGLHPSSVALQLSMAEDGNSTMLVLLANHVSSSSAGHVEVFTHPLHSPAAPLLYHSRIQGAALSLERRSQHTGAWRIDVMPEQWSPELQPGEEGDANAGEHALPSFFFTLKPAFPTSSVSLARKPTFSQFAAEKLLGRSLYETQPPNSDVGVYIARSNTSAILTAAGSAQHAWPAVFKSFDGAGEEAGWNTTRPILIAAHAEGEATDVFEWEQHWVRGIQAGIRVEQEPYPASPRARADGLVKTYVPTFANLFSEKLSRSPTALDADALGRAWIGESLDADATMEAWIDWLRAGAVGVGPPRPRGRVNFLTHLYRLGPSIAHPWELERLKYARERGIFLPKQYYSFTAFSSDAVQGQADEERWTPGVVTGLAVDRTLRKVILVSKYDERGIAVCDMPEWIEK